MKTGLIKSSQPMSKPISELTIDDFRTHPVWTWAGEDDERLVEPLEDLSQGHDALFIFSNFILSDGSTISGFIAIRTNDLSVYLVSLFGKYNRFFDIPLQLELRGLIDAHRIEEELDKGIKDIFPIRYVASYMPDNVLMGYIENFLA
jgi:hypothetical protein